MPATQTCARCGSAQHSTSECSLPFFRKTRQERLAEKAQKHEDWKAKDAAYQELRGAKQLLREQRKLQCGSDASSDAASTCAETVDADAPTGILALSPLEEKEARKIERKLRDIALLQGQMDQGISLDKLQLEKVRSKGVLESNLVMQKIRAGAHRPTV